VSNGGEEKRLEMGVFNGLCFMIPNEAVSNPLG
jgi:hypothetical protein